MVERVVPLEIGITWQPNAPNAVLSVSDQGHATLALRAHPDDPNQRLVVLRFDGCASAEMGAPNDETLHLHRLYPCGLAEVLWIGEVIDSSRLDQVAPMTVNQPPRHYILPLKEGVVEVLAGSVTVSRPPPIRTERAPEDIP